jgi:hypothetical protein
MTLYRFSRECSEEWWVVSNLLVRREIYKPGNHLQTTRHVTIYTGCFTTLRHNCRRWFPRSLWYKKFI